AAPLARPYTSQKADSAPGNIQSSSSRKKKYSPWAIAAPVLRAKLRSRRFVSITRTKGESCHLAAGKASPESFTTITSYGAAVKSCSTALRTARSNEARPMVGMMIEQNMQRLPGSGGNLRRLTLTTGEGLVVIRPGDRLPKGWGQQMPAGPQRPTHPCPRPAGSSQWPAVASIPHSRGEIGAGDPAVSIGVLGGAAQARKSGRIVQNAFPCPAAVAGVSLIIGRAAALAH